MEFSRARNILLCLRYGIGDVVMETPVLDALRRTAPAARLTVLGALPALSLLDGDARVDERVAVDRWGLRHRWDEGTAASREAFGAWLDERRFDLFLDVHHAAPAVGRVIWGRGIRSLEADEEAEVEAVAAGADSVTAIQAAVHRGWGLEGATEPSPRLHLEPEEYGFADAFLDRHGIRDQSPVGIAPVASLPMKRWPPERFAAVADWAVEELGRTPLLFCGPQHDTAAVVQAAMRHPDRAVSVGEIHLRQAAALLARCALVVCNDTGLLHMASAVGAAVVGVFGPTVPEIYLPRIPRVSGVVDDGIVCTHRNTASLHPPGCWASDRCLIAEHSCVQRVQVDAVLAAARRVLSATGPGGPRSREVA